MHNHADLTCDHIFLLFKNLLQLTSSFKVSQVENLRNCVCLALINVNQRDLLNRMFRVVLIEIENFLDQ
jgi:hypothetical protein